MHVLYTQSISINHAHLHCLLKQIDIGKNKFYYEIYRWLIKLIYKFTYILHIFFYQVSDSMFQYGTVYMAYVYINISYTLRKSGNVYIGEQFSV